MDTTNQEPKTEMESELHIPEWDEIQAKVQAGRPISRLESFVFTYDDSDPVRSAHFISSLRGVLREAIGNQ